MSPVENDRCKTVRSHVPVLGSKLKLLALYFLVSTAYPSGPGIVVLTSGNRMTGSVTEPGRGELTFSIDGAGSVGNVESLETTQTLDVELSSGQRLTVLPVSTPSKYGRITAAARPSLDRPST